MRQNKGFTIAEVAAVTAITAVLASLLFPVFSSTRERARMNQCQTNMQKMGKAMRLYLDAHDDTYPSAVPLGNYQVASVYGFFWLGTVSGEVSGSLFNVYEKGGLWPYVGDKDVYVCPSDYNQNLQRYNAGVNFDKKTKRPFGLSYGMNLHLTNTGVYGRFVKSKEVKYPAETVLFVDEGGGVIRNNSAATFPICDGHFGPAIDWPTKVHYGGTNVTFCDGHAQWVKMSYDGYGKLIWYTDPSTGEPWRVPNSWDFKKVIDAPRVSH
ncbi:MAG: type II secretion system protein [Abditibacteriota bacterium]|nr:type II secretion system protein [Abditibacteriota bacterium]